MARYAIGRFFRETRPNINPRLRVEATAGSLVVACEEMSVGGTGVDKKNRNRERQGREKRTETQKKMNEREIGKRENEREGCA